MKTNIVRQFTLMALLLKAAPSFFFTTYQLFLTGHGLSILEISLINSAYMITVFVLEVPTGAFADSYGRRKSIFWGCLILSLSFLAYYCSDSFTGFIIAEIIGGLGHCLISGALEAWAVDSLKEEKIDMTYEDLFKIETSYRQYGVIFGSFTGALVGAINLGLPWLLSSVAMIGAALYALRLKNDAKHKHKRFIFDLSPLGNTITESWHSGRKNPGFLRLAAIGAILAMSVQSMNMQWPILFNNRFDLPVWSLGLIFAGIAGFTALGARFAPLATRKSRHEGHSLAIALLITGAMMILSGQAPFVAPALIFFLLHEFGRGLYEPLKKAIINRRIDGHNRATMLSLDSMALSAGAFIGLVGGGWLGTQSIALAWTASGLLLVALFPLLYKKGI